MKLVRKAGIICGYRPLPPSFRKTKSEPAGDRSEYHPIISNETVERGMQRSTWDGRMHSSVRELAVDPDHKELKKALRKQSRLRSVLYGRRLQLKEKRNELRQERVLLADADGSFMKSVRRFPQQDQFEFEDRHRLQLEQQRDLVGSLEYEYDQAEDEYDIAENDLHSEEGKLNVLLSKSLNEHSDTGDEHTTEPSSDDHLQPEEPRYCNEDDEARTRLVEYQSRVGDARILEERLQDLWLEQEERNSFAKRRENLGVEMAGSDEDFNEYCNYRRSEIFGELGIIHADIERLKDALIQAGHIFPMTNPTDRPPEALHDQAHSRSHPASSPVARQRPLSESILQTLQKNFATTRAHISRWILKTFGSSPIECARHKDILRQLGDESLDDGEWARLVLEHWKIAECDGDDESWEILSGDLMEDTDQNGATRIRTSVLLSGRSEANHAMLDFMQQFPHDTPGDHARPYASEVELDQLCEYESRSI